MRILSSPDDLKEYCLRALGKPVINIEVEDTQIYDRIDDAMQWYAERHYSGASEQFLRVVFTAADEATQMIRLPSNVIAVTEIHEPTSSSSSRTEEFERLNFLLAQSDMFNPIGGRGRDYDLLTYDLTMQYLSMIKMYFSVKRTFNYNKVTNRIAIPSGRVIDGNWMILKVYMTLNPEQHSDIYNDEWLKKYATALIRRQWGSNLRKYEGVQMVGGITLNGEKIWADANEEITKLMEEFTSRYTLPLGPIWGGATVGMLSLVSILATASLALLKFVF